MMDGKHKYVRLKEYDSIIIFPEIIQHSDFKHMNPISAGFCYVNENSISCFGSSFSLGLDSKEDDSFLATRQIYGWEVAEKLLSQKR